MGYLDNSGDIILDAVLTDAGRARLAKGDGSFRIVKFALGDDEIDYALYNVNANTGYEDLRILKLPIFEAFTNNTSTLNSKLMTYSNNESLLYLPIIKSLDAPAPGLNRLSAFNGGYYAPCDSATYTAASVAVAPASDTDGAKRSAGILKTTTRGDNNSVVAFDQGLDSDSSLNWLGTSQPDLVEQQYIVEVDNRLLKVNTTTGMNALASPSFVDDDSIASYYFSLSNTPGYFSTQIGGPAVSNPGESGSPDWQARLDEENGVNTMYPKSIGTSTTTGLFGTRLIFGLTTSDDLRNQAITEGLWSKLGQLQNIDFGGGGVNFQVINTVIRVTGVNTGYRTDIPVAAIKKV